MFQLPSLPFLPESFEPFLSTESFEFHYNKHHRAYCDNLNKLLDKNCLGFSLEEVIRYADKNGLKILFNNAAQHWNHSFFWNSISPTISQKSEGLSACLLQSFGSFNSFTEEFLQKGIAIFGSGWIWLIFNKTSQKLEILQTFNAQTPIIDPNLVPIFVIDVWEHAYYIDYRNMRAQYLQELLNRFINWEFASTNFANILA